MISISGLGSASPNANASSTSSQYPYPKLLSFLIWFQVKTEPAAGCTRNSRQESKPQRISSSRFLSADTDPATAPDQAAYVPPRDTPRTSQVHRYLSTRDRAGKSGKLVLAHLLCHAV